MTINLRRIPQLADFVETIAWVEWLVSYRFRDAVDGLTGFELRPVWSSQNPLEQSNQWFQLLVSGRAGELAAKTKLGRDPFTPYEAAWRCPLGHSTVAQILSEVYIDCQGWNNCDIAVTRDHFGQGRNLLRPKPLIIISQKMFRAMRSKGLRGFNVEVAHFV